MGKRHLYRSKHLIDAYAFEAFCDDSWRAVELIRIKDGYMTIQFVDSEYLIEDRGPFSNVRIKSRKAALADCTCFLRPGIDVCALSISQHTESSGEENQEPVWLDAKIASIERKPHDSGCECQFYINFYVNQHPLGAEKGPLSKDTIIVEIDQISILQKLERTPCQVEHYRWNSSEDCCSVQNTKLFRGKFMSDLSWLLIASVMKKTAFSVRSVQNKIFYEILDGGAEKKLNAINFRLENDLPIPFVASFDSTDTFGISPTCDTSEGGPSSSYERMELRRSKRRYVQPDRFLGCDDISESDIASFRTGLFTKTTWTEDDLPLALLFQAEAPTLLLQNHSEDRDQNHSEDRDKVHSCKKDPNKKMLVYERRKKSKEVNSGSPNQRENKTPLAIMPKPSENDKVASEQNHFNAKFIRDNLGEIRDMFSENFHINGHSTMRKKNISEVEDMDFDSRWMRINRTKQKGQSRIYYYRSSRKERSSEVRSHGKRSLSASGYYEIIKTFMKNIESTMGKEEPPVMDQWKNFQATNCPNQRKVSNATDPIKDEEESSEIEMLWKEFELVLASSYFIEDDEQQNVEDPGKVEQKSSGERRRFCRHEYKLDEEIGIICQLCGFISTEIKDVSPAFLHVTSIPSNKSRVEEDSEHKQTEDENLEFVSKIPSSDVPLSEKNDNVWALIPDLREKLHSHQKKAFEFLWQNVAGSLVPALMDTAPKNRGGCVISHSPGAGKTFLIIAFLVSYLKLFPGKRPLVLAPKTTLYTWYKEFDKWGIPIPVHRIHNGRTYRMFRNKAVVPPGAPKPGNDIMHVLDCLDKIRKWHEQPSILIMGYTSFLTLTREDSKYPHRKYMCDVFRQSPGILILDEGHNPRSTKSRLRKALMKVETDLRILLSGTLFQNNFGEYFNTLCLARPKFVKEVLMELDPKFKRSKKLAKKPRILLESRARKFFQDEIASKINSNVAHDRIQGLNMLKNITNGFIDVYEGGTSDNLPGLQSYTLMMRSSHMQHEIMQKLHKERALCKRFPLELELLITLGSIHPCLIKTAACAPKYFSEEELKEFDKHKHDFRKGSKLKFVVSLVNHCIVRKEKVLIFCHNIAPINFLLEIFSTVYGWRKGKEVLVLQGDLELFERGLVMDKFEEVRGPSKVLLASITACAEGVSLTAASRVILLDSEWNPSKTKQAIARAFRPGQLKVVYVYQLLAKWTMEEEKYDRTTWKEWVSNMIFSEELVEDPSRWQKEKIEDDVLRDIVEEDWAKSFHMIMKNEKASKD